MLVKAPKETPTKMIKVTNAIKGMYKSGAWTSDLGVMGVPSYEGGCGFQSFTVKGK